MAAHPLSATTAASGTKEVNEDAAREETIDEERSGLNFMTSTPSAFS